MAISGFDPERSLEANVGSRPFPTLRGTTPGLGVLRVRFRTGSQCPGSTHCGLRRRLAGRRLLNGLLLPGGRNSTRPGFELGFGQEAKSCLAPREINADVQQGVGTSTRAGKFHDRDDAVRLPGHQGHGTSRAVVGCDIDAKNQIARADSVAQSFLLTLRGRLGLDARRAKNRSLRSAFNAFA